VLTSIDTYLFRVFSTSIFTFLYRNVDFYLLLCWLAHKNIWQFSPTLAPISRRNFCLRCSLPRSASSQLLIVWIYERNTLSNSKLDSHWNSRQSGMSPNKTYAEHVIEYLINRNIVYVRHVSIVIIKSCNTMFFDRIFCRR
jgi:hypothetical protein